MLPITEVVWHHLKVLPMFQDTGHNNAPLYTFTKITKKWSDLWKGFLKEMERPEVNRSGRSADDPVYDLLQSMYDELLVHLSMNEVLEDEKTAGKEAKV